jgi:hypothetical protein
VPELLVPELPEPELLVPELPLGAEPLGVGLGLWLWPWGRPRPTWLDPPCPGLSAGGCAPGWLGGG